MAVEELRKNAIERRNFLAPSLKFDDQKFEFIFCMDQSGSMHGDPMVLARRALVLFLRSLPPTCIFNIYSFGESFTKLYPKSVPYDEVNLTFATKHAEAMQANYPGRDTLLTPPLGDIYRSAQTPGYLTQVFALTDGQFPNNRETFNMVKSNKPFARVFSLGIGRHVDVGLVKGIAAEGGGVSDFVFDLSEKIETKVLGQLKIALRPSLLKAIPVHT